MTVDIHKLFNEELPAALAKNPIAAKAVGSKYQINITGEGGGEWFIDVSDSGPSCKSGNDSADCTITISAEDFQRLMQNPQANSMQLFFSGRLKIVGDQMLGMKLTKLLGLGMF